MKPLLVVLLLVAVGCSQTETRSGSGSDQSSTRNLGSSTASQAAPALVVGSKAPPLKVSRFLKGEPVTQFEPGKIYVVEFWATWCGPCVAAMPHVSQMQKKHPDVTFIGVNVWEEGEAAAEEFLKANGERIDYRIARDEIPPGAKADDGVMSQTWLRAAEAGGIPTAFVVNGEGKIAMITHPLELDEPLAKIINGTWDLPAAAKKHLDSIMEERQANRFQETLGQLVAAGPTVDSVAGLDKLAAEFPSHALRIGLAKFQLLASSEEMSELAMAEGRKLMDGPLADNPELLNAIAWDVVDPARTPAASADLQTFALEAARRADKQTGQKNMAIADTLARALFCNGDVSAAVEAQRRAVSLAQADGASTDNDVLKELQQRLREYEQASPAAKGDAEKSE